MAHWATRLRAAPNRDANGVKFDELKKGRTMFGNVFSATQRGTQVAPPPATVPLPAPFMVTCTGQQSFPNIALVSATTICLKGEMSQPFINDLAQKKLPDNFNKLILDATVIEKQDQSMDLSWLAGTQVSTLVLINPCTLPSGLPDSVTTLYVGNSDWMSEVSVATLRGIEQLGKQHQSINKNASMQLINSAEHYLTQPFSVVNHLLAKHCFFALYEGVWAPTSPAFSLGLLYHGGRFVPQSLDKANEFFKIAIEFETNPILKDALSSQVMTLNEPSMVIN